MNAKQDISNLYSTFLLKTKTCIKIGLLLCVLNVRDKLNQIHRENTAQRIIWCENYDDHSDAASMWSA